MHSNANKKILKKANEDFKLDSAKDHFKKIDGSHQVVIDNGILLSRAIEVTGKVFTNTFNEARKNPDKNRYPNCPPADDTLIPIPGVSYFNGSCIGGKVHDTVFIGWENSDIIVCQGTQTNTIGDFLRVLKSTGAGVVVSLVNGIENGCIKFTEFYDDKKEVCFTSGRSRYFVKVIEYKKEGNFIFRKLRIVKNPFRELECATNDEEIKESVQGESVSDCEESVQGLPVSDCEESNTDKQSSGEFVLPKFSRTAEEIPFVEGDDEMNVEWDVVQIQYIGWPDHGCPANVEEMFEIRKLMIANTVPGKPNIVHCSAGIGRSGTFVLIHKLLQQFESYISGMVAILDDFNLNEMIDNNFRILRVYRDGSIQTPVQYEFVHEAIQSELNKIA